MLLADAELEIVPERIRGHPVIAKYARKRGKKTNKILLDSSFHHAAMKVLDDWERRGRPDIVHMFMLLCLDSILNKEGMLKTLVYTRNRDLITVSPRTKLPKGYHRFVGLIEDLFEREIIPSEKMPLLRLRKNVDFGKLMVDINADRVLVLSPNGERVSLFEYFSNYRDCKNICCIVGGFPKGDYYSPVYDYATDIVSIYPGMLTVWTVVSEVIVAYEEAVLRA